MAAAAGLVGELVAQGVGRSVAVALARDKPDLCRRYLEYLPFADIRSSKGAWLTAAIRQEFGPPARYLRSRAGTRPHTVSTAPSQNTSPSREQARHASQLRRLRDTYQHLETTQPEAIAAFEAHLQSERERLESFARRLSLHRGREELADLTTEDYRWEQFGRWLGNWQSSPFDERDRSVKWSRSASKGLLVPSESRQRP